MIFGGASSPCTGVGHEIDFTIADFVADVRAPTPSAAAELITPDQAEVRVLIEGGALELTSLMADWIRNARLSLAANERALQHLSPRVKLRNAQQQLDDASGKMQAAVRHQLILRRERVISLAAQLTAYNPLNVLARGYAVVRTPEGEVIRSVNQVQADERLLIRVSDGEFVVRSE
jgi:exodeoxyribonuclease VII large subunit